MSYFEFSRQLAKDPPENTLKYDLHRLTLGKYANLPRWERLAHAMAEALENQAIYIYPQDRLIGRTYHSNKAEKEPERLNPELAKPPLWEKENYPQLLENQLVLYNAPGHIAWNWDALLHQGTEGLKKRCNGTGEFHQGARILLTALENWSDRHAEALEKLGRREEAALCRKVPRHPAESFREALQSFWMQHIVVMSENPHGGNSPGRLDKYLWPYLKADLEKGVCTLEDARSLIEELFIRIDERLYHRDGWVETVMVGGKNAVNPLSYLMIETVIKYDIVHPAVYVRLAEDSPADFIDLAAKYLRQGGNRAQLLWDETVTKALIRNGVSPADADDYFCGGCMEIGIQGKTADCLYLGFQNLPKFLELTLTGGISLKNGEKIANFHAKTLEKYSSFEDLYEHFRTEFRRLSHLQFQYQDEVSCYNAAHRPAYLISSMIADCPEKGLNMHAGGARYFDYGATILGIPNVADSLMAIKKAVFEEKFCTAEELLSALKANFQGYEPLRRRLLACPKYGQNHPEADAMAARVAADTAEVYRSYRNLHGGNGKPVILSFKYAPLAGSILGASPDGRLAGKPVAQGVTPQVSSMTKGITAAINSCTALPFEVFSGGASTMWDMEASQASEEVLKALFTAFFKQGGQIFQGNVADAETLLQAQKKPEDYPWLIVRVGGYSARFTGLTPELQNDIIARLSK
ncbi:MAG: hypothetical protein IJ043_05500 [Clostridia bacterium]|nr:hypothetical protein [Clostridia bacterium]